MPKNTATRRKRKFHGNRYKNQSCSTTHTTKDTNNTTSTRASKLEINNDMDNSSDSENYFIIINFEIMKNMFQSFSSCPECASSPLQLSNDISKRSGFSNKLTMFCKKCHWQQNINTSPECSKENKKQGRNIFEVNLRTVIAFREIGKGHEAIVNFSRCMNMHCLSEPSYRNINESLSTAYEVAASNSMGKAAKEVIKSGKNKKHSKGITMCRTKVDGSWQRRGHSSLNGVVTAISGNKCVDVQVLSKHCRLCHIWERKQGSVEYETWKSKHVCNINHTKSSGAMESAGAVEIFSRSVSKNELIYHEYLGDGDTSSFKDVVAAEPYKEYNVTPVKLECVGHVQKRLGTRLRNLVKQYKGTKTPLSGKGKLTERVINSMQNFYGIAIRQNCNNIYQMKKAIGAILWHCTAFQDDSYRHRFCPPGPKSWCKYLSDKETGKNTYKKRINLPINIHELLKPTFVTLSSTELLSKCLHGETQNANESINNIIWSKCPKNIFVSRPILEMGVNSAVLQFNDGANGIHEVLKLFLKSTGVLTSQISNRQNHGSIQNMERKSSEPVKKRRKQLRTQKKGLHDSEKAKELKESYVSGGF